MKYVKNWNYQVVVKWNDEEIATMYFMKLETAELYYNDMLARIVLRPNATVSLHQYALQYTISEKGENAL